MPIVDELPDARGADLTRRIIDAIHASDVDARIHEGLSVLEHAMMIRVDGKADADRPQSGHVDIEPEDFFDLLSIIMELPEPAARRVALTGLTTALDAPDFDAFRISCVAVHRFCGWVGPSTNRATVGGFH